LRNLVGNGWTIVEADSFAAGVASCGGHAIIEEVIAPVKLGLNRNPHQFSPVGLKVRMAKTKTHWRGPDIVMGYSVWFRIIDATSTVELLWIEQTNPDSGDGDDAWESAF
jgi:hypothetical protein